MIIRRLRISLYVRKIQTIFRSPAYQRQAYLRKRACLKMQSLLRQRRCARGRLSSSGLHACLVWKVPEPCTRALADLRSRPACPQLEPDSRAAVARTAGDPRRHHATPWGGGTDGGSRDNLQPVRGVPDHMHIQAGRLRPHRLRDGFNVAHGQVTPPPQPPARGRSLPACLRPVCLRPARLRPASSLPRARRG